MRIARIALTVPPDNAAPFRSLMETHTAEALAQPGCLRFEVSTDAVDTSRFYLYEEWSTSEEFEKYRDDILSPARPKLLEVVDGPPENRYFDADAVG